MKTFLKIAVISYLAVSIWVGCCIGSFATSLSRDKSRNIQNMVEGCVYSITHGYAIVFLWQLLK